MVSLAAMPAPARRAALYVRVSTADRGQTVENQLQPLQEAAGRLGWSIVAVFKDEGISGARGREKRPGLDALAHAAVRLVRVDAPNNGVFQKRSFSGDCKNSSPSGLN